MPVSYRFMNTEGTPQNLVKVEDEMCEFMGITPDPVLYIYQEAVAMMGITILMRSGGTKVTPEMFEDYILDDKTSKQSFVTEEMETVGREFLVNRYTFEAWR